MPSWLARLCLGIPLATLILLSGTTTAGFRFPAGSGGINAPDHLDKPYVVLVSVDGMRWDFPDRFELPATRRIIERGFRAERLIPVFPAVTFPNHYSIATGLYPDRHGLVANAFPAPELGAWYALHERATVEDGRFYGGEPVWVTAESQGMVSAAFYFVGTEAAIQGIRPSHWRRYDKDVPAAARVDQVLAWLNLPAPKRPHLLTLYFDEVDRQSHASGIDSPAFYSALLRVDAALGRLMAGIEALPHGNQVNVVVASDHGAATYEPRQVPFVLSDHLDLENIRNVGEGAFSFLYFADPDPNRVEQVADILRARWRHGRALRPGETPVAWQVGDNARWPELILMSNPGHGVLSRPDQAHRMNPGDHGWDPALPDMHGVLFGSGPGFRPGTALGAVRAVDVYPMLVHILSLQEPGRLDGDLTATGTVLATETHRAFPAVNSSARAGRNPANAPSALPESPATEDPADPASR